MSNPRLYLASIVFDVNGDRRTIEALVGAVDEQDAIGAAMDAVRQLHPEADILGGMLEPLDAGEATEPNAREATPRPAGATVH